MVVKSSALCSKIDSGTKLSMLNDNDLKLFEICPWG